MSFAAASFFTASFSTSSFLFNGVVPPIPEGGSSQGAPVGWGTGRKHRIAGQRHDEINIERRKPRDLSKLRIQEIDNHDIMLFVKTFRQFNQ